MTADIALAWIQRLAALSLTLQTLELLALRRTYADGGVWSWKILGEEFSPAARRALGFFLGGRSFMGLLALRLLGAIALPWCAHPAMLALLFGTSFAVPFRWRGSYNGGSDSMTLITLAALFVAGVWPMATNAALVFLAVEVALSYAIAGWAKLIQPEWRNGRMLVKFLHLPTYDVPAWVQKLSASRGLMLVGSWGVMLFESSFPLAFSGPTPAAGYLIAAMSFHLANVYLFGLNRFVWAWLAAYPAVLYCASR